jgi:hypothetical protein
MVLQITKLRQWAKRDHPRDIQQLVFQELNKHYVADENPEHRAADLHITVAQCYNLGWGVTKNEKNMISHLEKAAALGSSKASCLFAMLANYYNSGPIDTSQMAENSREVIDFLTCTSKTLSKLPRSKYYAAFVRQVCPRLIREDNPARNSCQYILGTKREVEIRAKLDPRVWNDTTASCLSPPSLELFHQSVRLGLAVEVVNFYASASKAEQISLLEAKDHVGRTAVLLACEGGHLEMMKSLVALGADISCIDSRGRCCLRWLPVFEETHIKEVADFIYQKAPKCIFQVSEYQLDDRTGWEQGGTPLHWATSAHNGEAVLALLDLGSNPTT